MEDVVCNRRQGLLHTTSSIVCAACPREHPASEGEASENQIRSKKICLWRAGSQDCQALPAPLANRLGMC